MKIKMNRLLENNGIVKIISLIISIFAWFFVSLVINPEISVTVYDIPIRSNIEGSTLDTIGLKVVDGMDTTVKATIKGKRYILGSLNKNNLYADINLKNITGPGEYILDYTINIDIDKTGKVSTDDYSIVNIAPSSIMVKLDRMIEKEYAIETITPNISAKEGFIVEEAYNLYDTIKLYGPEQDISKVDKIILKNDKKAIIDTTIILDGILEFQSKEGIPLILPNIVLPVNKFDITVPVYKSQIVYLTFDYINLPSHLNKDNIRHTISTSEINVGVPTGSNNNITDINLGTIDFRRIDIGSEFTFDIVLPSGYKNLSDVTNVSIKFNNDDFISGNYNVSNIRILNQPSDFDILIDTKIIPNVKVIGNKSVVENLAPSDIVGVLDFLDTKFSEGKSSVSVKFDFINGGNIWAVGEYTIIITSKKK